MRQVISIHLKKILVLYLLWIGLVPACSDFGSETKETVPSDSIVSFQNHIFPMFKANCLGCHGNNGGLSLESYEDCLSGTSNHGPVIIPGKGMESILVKKLEGTAEFGEIMPPPPAPKLQDNIIELIERWIDQGAKNN